jgi:hypothetical protein
MSAIFFTDVTVVASQPNGRQCAAHLCRYGAGIVLNCDAGWRRAHKHIDTPDAKTNEEQIVFLNDGPRIILAG